jgi:hypothetical protein
MRVLLALGVASSLAIVACGNTGDVDENASGTAATGATSGAGTGGTGSGSGGNGGGATSGTGAAGGAGATGSGGSGGGAGTCDPAPACDLAPPDPGAAIEWNHLESSIATTFGDPNHRGRDLFLNPGDSQWIIGKFAYGPTDKDIHDEVVDVWLLRDCTTWEMLGTALTSDDGDNPTVEGVDDTGGRIFFPIPEAKALGPGMHRVHLVVRGDLSTTDLFIEVVPAGTPVFVSDVDGTLTTSETEEYASLLTGAISPANPGAPEALQTLVDKGYRALYLTARPEWLVGRTREFLDVRGFPRGLVHTTLGLTGALGSDASGFKTDELAMLAAKGMVPEYAFGNTETDAAAYEAGGVDPLDHRVFFQFDDTVYGGRRIESYNDLLSEFEALPPVCQP